MQKNKLFSVSYLKKQFQFAGREIKNNPLLYPFLVLCMVALMISFKVMGMIKEKRFFSRFDQSVLIFSKHLSQGSMLQDEDFDIMLLPKEHLPANAVRSKEKESFIGQKLLRSVEKNEMLFWDQFIVRSHAVPSQKIPPGYRVISIPTDEVSSASFQIQSGDHVDLVIESQTEQQSKSFTLLQNVTVLSTHSLDDGLSYSSLSLMVLPEEVPMITHSIRNSSISLSLRNPSDLEVFLASPMVDNQTLLDLGHKNTLQSDRKQKIEILKGQNTEFF
ncbi:MAG: Flp pilus assembly protein CpaB [Bdellovibrionales bacterium]|nr:Flp pilus assembly protein CpaB [Bdellovibrionales bacterium]